MPSRGSGRDFGSSAHSDWSPNTGAPDGRGTDRSWPRRPEGISVSGEPSKGEWHLDQDTFDPSGSGGPIRGSALPRNGILLCGFAIAGVAIALGLIAHEKPVFAAAGWVLGLGCIGAVAAHTYHEAKRRAADWVLASQPYGPGRLVVLTAGLIAIVLNAWQFADWAAR